MFLSNCFSPSLFLREAAQKALQAAAEAPGGDLTIEQVMKLHRDQVCWYGYVRVCIY